MVFKRIYNKEIIDDLSIKDERIDDALKELKLINNSLGGYNVSKKAFLHSMDHQKGYYNILDIGAGSSDILLKLKKINFKINLYTLDVNIRACRYNRSINKLSNVICADINNLPFKEKYFDYVHASLFFHHFKENNINKVLQELNIITKKAIIINDLRRSFIAYWGIRILTMLFSKSKMVKNDAPLSVKRGFIKSDIIKFTKGLSFEKVIIKRRWAFRWMIIIYL